MGDFLMQNKKAAVTIPEPPPPPPNPTHMSIPEYKGETPPIVPDKDPAAEKRRDERDRKEKLKRGRRSLTIPLASAARTATAGGIAIPV